MTPDQKIKKMETELYKLKKELIIQETKPKKTISVKSINSIDTIYIFRDNNIEIEVRFEKNKVFSSLELTEQEKKDISKLMQFESPLWVVQKQKTPEHLLNEWYKNQNYTSKYIGVSWHKKYKKWQAVISNKGKLKFIGHYATEKEASQAYQKALKN